LTVSQPAKVAAVTGIDALSHAAESYVTTKRNPLAQMFAREAWKMLDENFEGVLRNPTDLDARGNMQMGAFLAGTAIENSMLGACHACANPLTAHYGLTHGIAVGILLPHVLRFNASAVGALYAELLPAEDPVNGDGVVAGDLLAQRLTRLMRLTGLPVRLSECGISGGILPVLAEEAAQQWTARFNPRPVTETDLLHLYEAAL
jgi:alcohol dehydrogenase